MQITYENPSGKLNSEGKEGNSESKRENLCPRLGVEKRK